MGIFSKRHLSTAGFSLVEMMVVIGVVGIMLTVGIPTFRKWRPSMEMKNAARGIYSTIQRAKLIAAKHNQSAGVRFIPGVPPNPDSYQIVRNRGVDGAWGTADDSPNGAGPDRIFNTADDIIGEQPILLPPGITFNSLANFDATTAMNPPPFGGNFITYANNTVVFNTTGYLFGVGFVGYVYISNLDTSYAIGTPTITGRIRLLNWAPASNNWFR